MKLCRRPQVMQFWLSFSLILLLMACRGAESLPVPTAAVEATLPTSTAENAIPTQASVSPTVTSTAVAETAVSPFPNMPKPDPDTIGATTVYEWFNLVNEANDTSPEENLVVFLKYFAGERPYTELFGDHEIDTHGLRALTSLAGELIASSSDKMLTTELSRLLNIISPTTEALENYAVAADIQQTRTRTVAGKLNRQPASVCREIWREGFPPPSTTPAPVCILHETVTTSDGDRYRLYYPIEWRDNSSLRSYLDATIEAVNRSETVFGAFGNIRSVNILFGTLSHSDLWMSVPTRSAGDTHTQPCPVVIYRNSWDASLGTETLTEDQFKQSVAHEIFHCVQEQIIGATTNYSATQWWQEGSAEYFSNVVYEDVNYEDRFASDFDTAVASELPLTRMSYRSYIFFQFLENHFGSADAVFALLRTLPVGGSETHQMNKLAAWPGMDTIFHAFTRAYIDGNIFDTNGIQAPTGGAHLGLYDGTHDATFSIGRFRLGLYVIEYEEGQVYNVNVTLQGSSAQYATKRGSGDWREFPERVTPDCEGDRIDLVLTTTDPEPAELEYDVEISEDEFGCDPCLIGSWRANIARTFVAPSFLSGAGPAVGHVEFRDHSGEVILQYTDSGDFLYSAADFSVTFEADIEEEALGPMVVEVSSNGTSAGQYVILEEGIMDYRDILLDTEGTTTISFPESNLPENGVVYSEPLIGGGFVPPESDDTVWEYACNDSDLSLTVIINGGEATWQQYFERINP